MINLKVLEELLRIDDFSRGSKIEIRHDKNCMHEFGSSKVEAKNPSSMTSSRVVQESLCIRDPD